MGARTTAREAALQMLFALEASGNDVDQVIHDFWRETPGDVEGKAYANELVQGTIGALGELDACIAKASAHWRLERMSRVDRNVLRLGVYELLHRLDVPRAVALDEAVELAKRYGAEESGSFVNGVLDQVADESGRAQEAFPDKAGLVDR
jgi:N utilization substance protein B